MAKDKDMFVTLDPLIDNYIKDKFTYEFGNTIKESFTLFDDYALSDYSNAFILLLMTQGITDPDNMQASFLDLINEKLDYMLSIHGVELLPEPNPFIKNTILRSMLDYIDAFEENKLVVTNFLYDDEMDEVEKFSHVISHFCTTNYIVILGSIKSISSDLIDKMIHLIDDDKQILRSPEISIDAYRVFKIFIGKHYPKVSFTIADSLIISSFSLGLDIKDYLPFCNKYILSLKEFQLAINIFSLYIISSNYIEGQYIETLNFIHDYYQNSGLDMNITETFTRLLNEFETFLKDFTKDE